MTFKNLKPETFDLAPIYSGCTWIMEFNTDIDFSDATGNLKINHGNGLFPTVTFDTVNNRFTFTLAKQTLTADNCTYEFTVTNSINETFPIFNGNVQIRAAQ